MVGALALPGTDAAQHLPSHEDLLSTALPLGVAHQGISLTGGGHTLLRESQTRGTPAAKT